MSYQYAQGDLLETPQHYQYSAYEGRALIDNWQQARQAILAILPSPSLMPLAVTIDAENTTEQRLTQLCMALREQEIAPQTDYWLPVFIKKFEVTKRLYQHYATDAPHKRNSEEYRQLTPYLLLAESIAHQWYIEPKSYLASCLLKLCDTLSTQISDMTPVQQAHFAWVLEQEATLLQTLMTPSEAK